MLARVPQHRTPGGQPLLQERDAGAVPMPHHQFAVSDDVGYQGGAVGG